MNLAKCAALPLASFLLLVGCARPVKDAAVATDTRADESAVRTAGLAWNDGITSLDVDAVVALYADDAMLMPQTAVAARGRDEIRKSLAKYFAKLRNAPFSMVIPAGSQIRVSGDLGVRWGPYSIVDANGVSQDTGKWLQVWSRKGGTWQISLEITNSDQLPLFPPDPPTLVP